MNENGTDILGSGERNGGGEPTRWRKMYELLRSLTEKKMKHYLVFAIYWLCLGENFFGQTITEIQSGKDAFPIPGLQDGVSVTFKWDNGKKLLVTFMTFRDRAWTMQVITKGKERLTIDEASRILNESVKEFNRVRKDEQIARVSFSTAMCEEMAKEFYSNMQTYLKASPKDTAHIGSRQLKGLVFKAVRESPTLLKLQAVLGEAGIPVDETPINIADEDIRMAQKVEGITYERLAALENVGFYDPPILSLKIKKGR